MAALCVFACLLVKLPASALATRCAVPAGKTGCGGSVLQCLAGVADIIEQPECVAELRYFEKMAVHSYK